MLSLLLQEKTVVTKSGLYSIATLVQPFQGDRLILTTEPLGVPGTLLIDLTMKPATGF